MTVKFRDIKKGQLLYEGAYGVNIELVAMEDARFLKAFGQDEGPLCGRAKLGFDAKDTKTGRIMTYEQTEGLSYYGPSLYQLPPYVQMRKSAEGLLEAVFPMLGAQTLDLENPDQKAMREPEVLAKWIASGTEEPLADWFHKAESALSLTGESPAGARPDQDVPGL